MESDEFQDWISVYQQLIPYVIGRSTHLPTQLVFLGVESLGSEGRLAEGYLIAVGQLTADGHFSIVSAGGADTVTTDMLSDEPFLIGLQNTPGGAGNVPANLTPRGTVAIPLPSLDDFKAALKRFGAGSEKQQLCQDVEDHIVMILESGEYFGLPLYDITFNHLLEINDTLKSEKVEDLLAQYKLES